MFDNVYGDSVVSTDFTAVPITYTTGGMARGWSISRSHVGPMRWRWTATGPKGSRSGWAHSEAVARVRALRAYGELV